MTDLAAVLRAVAPRANPAFVAASADLPAIMAQHGFTNVEAQASLISQTAHESGFRTFSENLNYSAARLRQVWPNRFKTMADAQRCAGNPRALANEVYNGRMGNRPGSNDGWDFRGSAVLQHTGRSEFERVQKRTGLAVVATPDLLRDAAHAEAMWQAACTFFVDRGALEVAKAGNVEKVTRRVNGGTNGLADRQLLYKRALAALGGKPMPAGKTTLEQSEDAKRRAKQSGALTLAAAPTSGGGAHQGAGLEAGQVAAIVLIVVGIGVLIGGLFWRRHKQKQAAVEVMRLEAIEQRAALAA